MYVSDKMSKNVITVSPEYSVSTALDIMSTNHLHRLPVVDKDGRLLGLITGTIISKNSPSNATTLSVFEINHFLNKLKVNDIMIPSEKLVTIGQDALLEEAAVKMRSNEIGCLPVVEDGKILGIITHNDIFEAFIELNGYYQTGTRYVIQIEEDSAGIMHSISGCFASKGVNISNIAVYPSYKGVEVIVIATGDGSDSFKEDLEKAGWNVTSVMELGKK